MLLVKIVDSFGSQTQGIPAAEPTTPTFSPGTWQLTFSDGTPLVEPQVVASGMPMEEPIRFVACVVEHSRSNDAEFQVLNKAAEASPHGGDVGGTNGPPVKGGDSTLGVFENVGIMFKWQF